MRISPIQGVNIAMKTPTEKRVWIYSDVVDSMTAEAESKSPRETGGVLMGYFQQQDSVPVILLATKPGPNAIHLPHHYKPDYEYDEVQIANVYEKSNRRITYMGDWHTHLLPRCNMSYRDKNTLRRIAAFGPARVNEPIMLIHCFSGEWTANVWQGKFCWKKLWGRRFIYEKRKLHVFG